MNAPTVPRVLVDLSVAPPGGAGTYATGFVTGLLASTAAVREQVVVVFDAAWASERPEVVERLRAVGVTVDLIDFPTPGTWKARLRRGGILRQAIERHQVDVAYFPREVVPRVAVPYALLAHNLHAWTTFATTSARTRSTLSAFLLRRAAWSSARRAAAVMVVSEAMLEVVDPRISVTAVVHHGCALPEHDRSGQARPLDGERRVAMVCTLMANKRVEVVIEAVAIARERSPRWRLDVYGGVGEAAYAQEVGRTSERLLGERVLRGPLPGDELATAYQQAHLLVVGGSFESFCFPLVEAMRSGCVVVAPESALVRELCGDAAITYPEGDAGALAEALEEAWQRWDELTVRSVERSRPFTWERAVEQALSVTRSVAGPARTSVGSAAKRR
jgi:glycosyltransferase involved in cell wall biosynthesis